MSKMTLQVLINTIASYASKFIKIISSFFLTKCMISSMPIDQYGFWSLLWMIFGYTLILDFGFGMSVQKAAAEKGDSSPQHVSSHLSTIFFIYSLMSMLIVIFTFVAGYNISFFVNESANLSLEKAQEYFILFGLLAAAVFPTGVFRELITGYNRIDIKNYILLVYEIIHFFVIYYLCINGYELSYLIIFSLAANLTVNILCYIYSAYYFKISIRFKHFDRTLVSKIVKFSLNAYMIMCCNLIILKTDQILLSTLSTLTMVGLYQIGSRIPYLMKMLNDQFLESIIPITARMSQGHDKMKNIKLIFDKCNRVTILIATISLFAFWFGTESILKIWLDIDTPEAIIISKILVLSTYINIVGKSVINNMGLVLDEEKKLARLSMIEAIANLVLSLVLIPRYGVVGAALGTVIPQFILVSLFYVPMIKKTIKVDLLEFFYQPLLICLLIGSISGYALNWILHSFNHNLLSFIVVNLLYAFTFLSSVLPFYLRKEEKKAIIEFFLRKYALIKTTK